MSEPIEPGLPMRRVIHSEIVFLLTLIIIYGLQLGETVAQETVVQKTTARHTATQENATRQTVAQNTTLQSPEQFLGYEPGERFTPHHRVLDYARHVAETSDRVTFHPYGTTYENRELYYLVVTTPENHRHIDEIRQNNLRLTGLEEGEPTDRQRAILWFSYNVHGNEPSSSEAALITLYDLADPSNSQTGEWLESSVIIMDPMLNPDGRERYVNWYRQMEGVRFNPDPLAREHHEPWPGGRFNHYYFDLNRDWAWQTQKETRQRIPVYHEWMPHIHVDFHEQHYTAPYYFAPAAEPFHEAISDWQREFQTEIGRNHMRYFDEKGWLYFTREVFDLFYPSYGDTWPTFNGAVGMTYEQAGHSRAGRGIQLPEGEILTLRDRLEHHYVTGMSTIEITSRHADRVVREFAAQFEGVLSEPEGDYGSYLIRGNNHPDKIHSLLRYLDDQQIRYGLSGRSASVEGYDYQSGEAGTVQVSERDILISARQPQSRLVQTLFEPQPALSDSVTYDITAWEAHYRFGLEGSAITSLLEPSQPVTAESYRQQFMDEESQLDGEPTQGFQNLVEDQEVRVRSSNQSDTVQREGAETGAPAGERRESLMRTTESDSPYAWVLPWNSMDDARFLAEIMRHDVRARFAMNPFRLEGETFDRGTVIITQAGNRHLEALDSLVTRAAESHSRSLFRSTTGAVSRGSDFGSATVRSTTPPAVAMVAGPVTDASSAGEIWHFFDQQLHYPLTVLNVDQLKETSLETFDVLILPPGTWSGVFDHDFQERLKTWIGRGGRLIAVGSANRQLAGLEGFSLTLKDNEQELHLDDPASGLAIFGDQAREAMRQANRGSVFRITMDPTHPLAFGYSDHYFSMKLDATPYSYLENGWSVGTIRSDAHMSGFAGEQARAALEHSLSFGVQEMGSGAVYYLIDNPLFRGFWENGKLLFVNAIFQPHR